MDGFRTIKFSFFLGELRKFLRIETCAAVTCIALSGYLLFNPAGLGIVFIALTVFFGCGASYAYNQFTDKKEDAINNKGINIFAGTRTGYYLIAVCMIISIVSVLQLSLFSMVIYAACIAGGAIYSAFRIKRFFPMKNLYSGLFLSSPFFVGAAAGNVLTIEMVPYFLLIFLITMTSNLNGDIRGYVGDRISGLRTIPVVIGMKVSMWLIHLNVAAFSLITVMLGYYVFIPMIPLLAASLVFLDVGDHVHSRSSMVSTFFVMIFSLVVVRMFGV